MLRSDSEGLISGRPILHAEGQFVACHYSPSQYVPCRKIGRRHFKEILRRATGFENCDKVNFEVRKMKTNICKIIKRLWNKRTSLYEHLWSPAPCPVCSPRVPFCWVTLGLLSRVKRTFNPFTPITIIKAWINMILLFESVHGWIPCAWPFKWTDGSYWAVLSCQVLFYTGGTITF